jgi:hypothetical protein
VNSIAARLAVAAALALACSGSSNEMKPTPDCPGGPPWTCMGSGNCPLADMAGNLCAVGRADSISSESLGIETASARARTELARVIDTRASGFIRAVQDSMSKSGAGEDAIQKVGSFNQNVTKRTLNGVTIPRTYYNRDTKMYYALATIDAKQFAAALKDLKQAGALSDDIKKEIDRRADAIVDEAERASQPPAR